MRSGLFQNLAIFLLLFPGLAYSGGPFLDSGDISVSPVAVDYGLVLVGTTSIPVRISIGNIGNDNLTISGISDPGAPFELSNLPAVPVTVPSFAAITFDVLFRPTNGGVADGVISISSDDPNQPTVTVILTGEGIVFVPATPGVCYGSTGMQGDNPGSLIMIDPATGAGTLIGSTGLDGVPGLAINSQGEIFGTERETGALYRFDAATADTALVFETGLGFLDAIAFDENDQLYGVDATLNLYKIDFQTLTIDTIGSTGDLMTGLAFDPTDGTLWGSVGGLGIKADGIYTVDTTNGAGNLVGETGLGGATPDIHFDAEGNLFGVKGGGPDSNNFIAIDKSTGAGTIIGPVGFRAVSGLAFFRGNGNSAPSITPIDDQMVDEEKHFELQVDASDPDGDDITFSLTQNPGWLSIDSGTGLLSGDPTSEDIGVDDVTVKVEDDKGAAGTASFAVEVKNVNMPPGSFALLEPADGSEIDDLNPTLSWEESMDPDAGDNVAYELIVSTMSDFSDTLISVEVSDLSYQVPSGLDVSMDYYWKVIASDNFGATTESNAAFMFSTSDNATNIDENFVPTRFSLDQNYPNPFNPETKIRYEVPKLTHVKITILNLLGQTIRILVDEAQPTGAYLVIWDGRRDNGEPVASGIYIYQFLAGEYRQYKKMVLQR